MNNFYTEIGRPKPIRTADHVQDTLGGLTRTHRLQRVNEARENIEEQFISQAERAIRSERQLNERRAKRSKQVRKQAMKITRTSVVSGITRTQEVSVDEGKFTKWDRAGQPTYIQNEFPELSDDDREFIMSGITPEEWDELFEDEDEN